MNENTNKTTEYISFLSCLPTRAVVSSCKTLSDIYYYHFTWDALHGSSELFYAGPVGFWRHEGVSYVLIDNMVSTMSREWYCGLDKGAALDVFINQGAGEILKGKGSVKKEDMNPLVTDFAAGQIEWILKGKPLGEYNVSSCDFNRPNGVYSVRVLGGWRSVRAECIGGKWFYNKALVQVEWVGEKLS